MTVYRPKDMIIPLKSGFTCDFCGASSKSPDGYFELHQHNGRIDKWNGLSGDLCTKEGGTIPAFIACKKCASERVLLP